MTPMTVQEAQKYAVQLLWETGLGQQGWRVVFDNAVRRAGQCRYTQKEIGISRKPMAARTAEGTMNTIRHEVAHALTRGDRHGPRWQAKYLELGGTGQRTVSGETFVAEITGRYKATCAGCGRDMYMHRRPQRVRACGVCCREKANNRFDRRFVLYFTDTKTNQLVAAG